VPLVQHAHEAGRVALGRDVAAPRRVRGRQQQEGRAGDELRLGSSTVGDSFLIARSLGVPISSRSSLSEVTTRLNIPSSSRPRRYPRDAR